MVLSPQLACKIYWRPRDEIAAAKHMPMKPKMLRIFYGHDGDRFTRDEMMGPLVARHGVQRSATIGLLLTQSSASKL
jgi:hypothetical protein